MIKDRYSFILYAILAASFFALIGNARAHPHVFVGNRFQVVFDNEGLAGIRVNWVFDRYFSQMIAEEFDSDRDGKLNATEITDVKKNAFCNLAEYQYLTFVKINEKPLRSNIFGISKKI